MKKTIIYLMMAAGFATLTSCKCQLCSKDNLPDQRFCKDDFNSNNDYNDAIDFWENLGYKCKGTM